MKIVFLNPSGELGGAERVLLDVLASLRAAEPSWRLHLVVSAEGPLVLKAGDLGVPTTVVPFPPALSRLGDSGANGPAGRHIGRLALLYRLASASVAVGAYVRHLRRALREIAPDVVHTNGLKMHILGLWADPSRIPVIWHIHDYVSARPIMARLLRRYADRSAGAIAISRSVAADAESVCGTRLRIHPVYNAVDLGRFQPNGPLLDLDSLAGLSPVAPGTVRVGLLATMGRWKGQETFLRALSLLPADLPVRGYLVGGSVYKTDGSQYSLGELQSYAKKLGIANRVGFTGFVEDAASAMRSLDIVVHASTQPEPFGLERIAAAKTLSSTSNKSKNVRFGKASLARCAPDVRDRES